MTTILQRLRGSERGSVIAEFAAAMPVLVLLLLAGVEVSRYALLNQKLDRLATTMGDLVAQAETLSSAELNNLFFATPHVAWPFDITGRGVVIITSVGVQPPPPGSPTGTPPSPPTINWQRKGGGTLLTAASQIGTSAGSTASLPTGLQVRVNETVIAAEVYFEFSPMFLSVIVPPKRLYHRAFFRPRLGSLTTLT